MGQQAMGTEVMETELRQIDDETMRHYIVRGYFTVQSELPAAFHAGLVQRLDTVLAAEGNWGNNILPRLPEIRQVFRAPEVHGALASILGPNYIMHPHRYPHCNVPGSAAQSLHKDATHYSGDVDIRHHRSRWAMAFYYPQDVTEDMGPTSILPGTQYYEDESHDPDNAELLLCGGAGTVTIVNFDIWHRATANCSGKRRYMLKFLFARTEEPARAAWRAASPNMSSPPIPSAGATEHENDSSPLQARSAARRGRVPGTGYPLGGVGCGEVAPSAAISGRVPPGSGEVPAADKHYLAWRTLWNWIQGEAAPTISTASISDADGAPECVRELGDADPASRRSAANNLGEMGVAAEDAIPALATALCDQDEAVRLNASYALGTIGAAAVPALITEVLEGTETGRRHAACALSLVGRPAVRALLQGLEAADWKVRAVIVDILGEIGAVTPEIIPALIRALGDESEWVRRHAADAAGTIGPAAAGAAPGLMRLLNDPHPFVRINAATALVKIGPAAAEAVPGLIVALEDTDRYVRGFAALALRRIGTEEAREALFDLLETSRWCPVTTIKSPY